MFFKVHVTICILFKRSRDRSDFIHLFVHSYGQTGTGKTFTMEGERSSEGSLSWEEVREQLFITFTLNKY